MTRKEQAELADRCQGCGKTISRGRVAEVSMWGKSGREAWGKMHEQCFLLRVGDRRGMILAARSAAA